MGIVNRPTYIRISASDVIPLLRFTTVGSQSAALARALAQSWEKAEGSDLTEERLVSAANLRKPRDRQYHLLVNIKRAHTSQS